MSHRPTSFLNQIHTSNATHDHNQAHLKLNFPTFGGSDPTGWIFRAEQDFEFKGINPQQQVQLASFHLEGVALQWYRWFTKFRGPSTWVEFTQAILRRFGPTDYDDPSEALGCLKQVTTMAAYQEQFEQLSHRVDNLPKSHLVGSFIAGLKDDVRLDVHVKQPRTLSDAISVARLIEEGNNLQRRPSFPTHPASTTPPSRLQPNTTASILGPSPPQKTTPMATPSQLSFRRITGQESKARQEKGLCYYCDEKYVPGHRCERPQLFMLEDLTTVVDSAETKPSDDDISFTSLPEISLHAMAGTTHPQTLRVLGKLKNRDLTVLIDGGNTYNFLDQSVVTKCGLPVIRDKTLQVMVRNGEKVDCSGRCLALTLEIQGHQIQADFFVLPVTACQAVLGVQWLETLGPVETDYRQLKMTFQ